ncbi:MAG TPA: ferrochelatase, partial [Thermoanaerobaculia bacterium]|nr:ferrochelatase [Thermoanaerobaculia bacterium]HSK78181.1 ferrochelatase [Thermoanaerobaculia bacterium]
ADCLETLEEIDEQNREIFLHNGGERYRYILALNDRPDHIQALCGLILRNLEGWAEPAAQWNEERVLREAAESRDRAEALKGQPVLENAGY